MIKIWLSSSTRRLFNLCLCIFGIQFATALQMTNISSVFKFLGAPNNQLPFLWLAAPISGLLIQPIIGQLSDNTHTRFGKRRPYLFIWMLAGVISLSAIIFSPNLMTAVSLVWVLDCSFNGMNESFRALIADTVPKKKKTSAFGMQTILAGLGATIAAATPWILENTWHVHSRNVSNLLPNTIRYAFLLGTAVLFVTVMWTLFTTKEQPCTIPARKRKVFSRKNLLSHFLKFWRGIFFNIARLPNVIRELYSIQIFTWIGMFAMWLYFSLAISQNIFGLGFNASLYNKTNADLLAQGTIWTGVFFATYQLVSVIFAFIIFKYIKQEQARFIHGCALLIGAVSLITIAFIHHLAYAVIPMIGIGIMWGSIMSLPYAILADELPEDKIGFYLGFFNITITVPQIIAGIILGPLTSFIFKNHAGYTVLTGGASIAIGGFLMLVQYYQKYKGYRPLKVNSNY